MSGCIALIVGAGRGHRFGGDLPKQYSLLGGKNVLARTIEAFTSHSGVDGVRVVIHPDDRQLYDKAVSTCPSEKLLPPVNGGATRQDSVRLGLESIGENIPFLVLIHDAARPFVTAEIIDRVIAALDDAPGAIAALPVVDTLKSSDGERIGTTVDRTGLWRAQTPQGFRYSDILSCHRKCANRNDLTDDAAVAETAGLSVQLVTGHEDNVKITTMDDLQQAERKLTGMEHRTGLGVDVHRFCPGDEITLCGVDIPHTFALDGHSDADVALHALTDALLGALGEGDIGTHFPPSDPQWKGVASSVFLEKARDLVRASGGTITNVDITVICEEPKIGPHRSAMVTAVAQMLKIEEKRVSVKATTTERLGFTGRGEGIAAEAIATLRMP